MKTLKKITVVMISIMMIGSISLLAQKKSAKAQIKNYIAQVNLLADKATVMVYDLIDLPAEGNLTEAKAESTPALEDWMLNSDSWNASENEKSDVSVQNWMLNSESWNNSEADEKNVEIKDWMLNDATWANAEDEDVNLKEWMLNPSMWNSKSAGTFVDNVVTVDGKKFKSGTLTNSALNALDKLTSAESDVDLKDWMMKPEVMAPALYAVEDTAADKDIQLESWMLSSNTWAK